MTISFDYKEKDFGIVIEKYNGTASVVNVPYSIAGKSVIEIAKGAFAGCKNLKEIQLPFGMKEFSLDAFDGCTDLEEISWNNFRIVFDSDVFKMHDKEIHLPKIV